MNELTVTSAQYMSDVDGNNVSIKATIDSIETLAPLDTANRHYQAILEWASQDGNTIQDAS